MKKTKCVHCLNEFNEITYDHLMPRSWYPSTTPQNLEKWKFPSCRTCNEDYGRIEERILNSVGLCLNHDHKATKGIVEKALRSIDMDSAKGEKDKIARQSRKSSLYNNMVIFDRMPEIGVLPNFGGNSRGTYNYLTIPIYADDLFAFGEKIARGLKYILDENKYLGHEYKVETFICREEALDDFEKFLQNMGKEYNRGPGLKVIRVVATDDIDVSISKIVIWESLMLYIFVDKNSVDEL